MKNNRFMSDLCLLFVAGALYANQWQIGGVATGVLAFALMMGCCLVPMLFVSRKSSGCCCGGKKQEVGDKQKAASCH